MALDRVTGLDVLEREGRRMIAALVSADPDRPCPTCGEWTLDDLAAHVGRVYAWAGTIIATGSTGPPDRSEIPTQPHDEISRDWMAAQLGSLLASLRSLPDDELRWNFLAGTMAPSRFWWRRQLHETAIHRVDAELGCGYDVSDLEADVAADGVQEYLELLGLEEVEWDELELGGALSVHLHATDAADTVLPPEWTIATGDHRFARAHQKADVAVRGTAWALNRWCWGRLETSSKDLEIFGDAAALDAWRPRR